MPRSVKEDPLIWRSVDVSLPAKPFPAVLITNNIGALDAYGHCSHIWITRFLYREADGEITSFDWNDQKVRNITHWRPALPEEWDNMQTVKPQEYGDV